jgi:predicted KAP-like P-loop ATPase
MFLNDNPIESKKDDELDRYEYSKNLAKAILNYNSKDNLVIGICGEWGSGKTSIINMALKYIDNEYDMIRGPIIFKFNPWNFSDQNNLTHQFFKELSLTLPGSNEKFEDIRKRLVEYANIIAPPFSIATSVLYPAANPIISPIMEYLNSPSINTPTNDLDSLKSKLEESLYGQNRKIIIVIDDIDRLNKSEIQQMFQLVKSQADFPNLIYLLAFDRQVVIESLKAYKFDGFEYLKKVVPITLDVPSISEFELRKIFNDNLDELIATDLPERSRNLQLIMEAYDVFLNSFFKNIRDLKRYMNTVKFVYGIVKNEVYLRDFFVITAIQVFLPKLYAAIKENKKVFIYESDYSDVRKEVKELQRQILKDIIDIIIKESFINRNTLLAGLNLIFPKISYLQDESYDIMSAPGRNDEFKIAKMIQSEEHFDTYFRFSVPKWELSHLELEHVLLSTENLSKFTKTFMELPDKKKGKFLDNINLNLRNAISFAGNEREISENELKTMHEFFVLNGHLIKDDLKWVMERVAEYYVERYDNTDLKETQSLIEKSENPSTSCHLIEGLYEGKKIDTKLLDDSKRICSKKISAYVNEKGLKDLWNLFFIFRFWKEGRNEKEFRETIETLSNDDLLIIISNYMKTKDAYEKKTDLLEDIFDLKILENKLESLLIKPKLTEQEISNIKNVLKIIRKN